MIGAMNDSMRARHRTIAIAAANRRRRGEGRGRRATERHRHDGGDVRLGPEHVHVRQRQGDRAVANVGERLLVVGAAATHVNVHL